LENSLVNCPVASVGVGDVRIACPAIKSHNAPGKLWGDALYLALMTCLEYEDKVVLLADLWGELPGDMLIDDDPRLFGHFARSGINVLSYHRRDAS
jgi:hypothetical protein